MVIPIHEVIQMICFNSRSREGSDLSKVDGKFLPSVSIHAPVKGATLKEVIIGRVCASFNSRSREGSDLFTKPVNLFASRVSIHAPVKGATIIRSLSACETSVSIHAPVKGATVHRRAVRRARTFQFTLP